MKTTAPRYTKLQIFLEAVGILLLLGMFLYLCLGWSSFPDQVPIHYNAIGEIDRWGGKGTLLTLPVVGCLLFGLLTAVSFLPSIWNSPVKLTQGNREAVRRVTRTMLLAVKAEMAAIYFYLTVYSSTGRPLPGLFSPLCFALMAGTLALAIAATLRAGRAK